MLCPRCAATAEPDSLFCEACGAALAETAVGLQPTGLSRGGAGAPTAADHREIDLGPDLAAVSDRGLIHRQNEDAVALSRGITGDGVPISGFRARTIRRGAPIPLPWRRPAVSLPPSR